MFRDSFPDPKAGDRVAHLEVVRTKITKAAGFSVCWRDHSNNNLVLAPISDWWSSVAQVTTPAKHSAVA